MNRRKLLKTISLSLGYTIAYPSILELLSSCETKKNHLWVPEYLNKSQGHVISHLTQIILPSSETVGANEVNVPQFIDLILKDLIPNNEKDIFLKGSSIFDLKFKELFDKDVLEGTSKEFSIILSSYFNISLERKNHIFQIIKKPESEVLDLNLYYIYKFLIFIRTYTLLGYFTAKKVGVEILHYNSIPGDYNSCTPINEVGNISSL